MDADRARQTMVEKANVALAAASTLELDGTAATSAPEAVHALRDLAESVHDLDEWLRAGGVFPDAWGGPNPVRVNDGRKRTS